MITNSENGNFEAFFNQFPVITFEKGERVVRPGELETNIVLIKSGVLRVYTTSKRGKKIAITCLNPPLYKNFILGLAPFFNKYYIEALTPVEIWKTPKKEFLNYAEKHSNAYISLVQSLHIIIKDLYYQIEWLKTGNACQKIATLLYNLATRLGKNVKGIRVVEIKTTHQELASLSGLTRETVTAKLNKLKKKKIIQYKDGIIKVANINRLKAESNL